MLSYATSSSRRTSPRVGSRQRYLLDHRHAPEECAAVHASWNGFTGWLRQGVTAAICARSGHGIWWALDAGSDCEALAQLPAPVAARTRAITVG
jgi:hypothetical protein